MLTTFLAGLSFGSCVGLVLAYRGLVSRISDLESSHADLSLDFMHHDALQREYARLKGWIPSQEQEDAADETP